MDCLGNDQADLMAAKGRSQHEIDQWLKGWLKVIEHTVTTYHQWTAFTAAAQHNGDMAADHDKRDPNSTKKRSSQAYSAKIGNDQRVLSRISYASRSQGMATQMTVKLQPHVPNLRPFKDVPVPA